LLRTPFPLGKKGRREKKHNHSFPKEKGERSCALHTQRSKEKGKKGRRKENRKA
jgi:hypothetical protein